MSHTHGIRRVCLHPAREVVCVCVCVCVCSVVSDSLGLYGLQPPPGNSPGNNTGVGCHFLLQGIFPAQGSNPGRLQLLHWQTDGFFTPVPSGKPPSS